jgi:hypothetical protein
VVRLGGGVFYERIQGNMTFNQINYPSALLTPKIYYGNLSTVANSSGTRFPLNVAGLPPQGRSELPVTSRSELRFTSKPGGPTNRYVYTKHEAF